MQVSTKAPIALLKIKGNYGKLSSVASPFSCAYKAWHGRSSMLISYLSQCSVHCLYEEIQVSFLGCPVTSERAILEDRHTISAQSHLLTFLSLTITPIIFLSVSSISFVLPSPVAPTSDSYFLIAWYCVILPTVINTRPNSQDTTSLGIKKDIFIKIQAVTSAITSFPASTDTGVGEAVSIISSPACTQGEGWC